MRIQLYGGPADGIVVVLQDSYVPPMYTVALMPKWTGEGEPTHSPIAVYYMSTRVNNDNELIYEFGGVRE